MKMPDLKKQDHGWYAIKLLTTQFIDPGRMEGWVGLGWLVTYRNKLPPLGVINNVGWWKFRL